LILPVDHIDIFFFYWGGLSCLLILKCPPSVVAVVYELLESGQCEGVVDLVELSLVVLEGYWLELSGVGGH
jgi:hypothetical protein